MSTAAQLSPALVSTGASVATWLAPASAAGPIGLAAAGVAIALSLIFSRKGPQQKVASTRIVDDLEPILSENRDGYLNNPQRTEADRLAALANFDEAWRYLTSESACGAPQLGEPGRRCISDRAPGGQWDWWRRYRDPIDDGPALRAASPADILNTGPAALFASDPLELLANATEGNSLPILAIGLILIGAVL